MQAALNRKTAQRLSVAREEASEKPGFGRLSKKLTDLMGTLQVPNQYGRISQNVAAL